MPAIPDARDLPSLLVQRWDEVHRDRDSEATDAHLAESHAAQTAGLGAQTRIPSQQDGPGPKMTRSSKRRLIEIALDPGRARAEASGPEGASVEDDEIRHGPKLESASHYQ